jgi:anthranilate phosphoribosyltransferase
MTVPAAFSPIAEVCAMLAQRRDLSAEAMSAVLDAILGGAIDEAETTAFLVAMRQKGETAEEMAAAARVLRKHMVCLDTGGIAVLDTCGTGGDGSGTFNISTATALVVAGAGVPVVKHGNRAQSSRSGSADVLTALGVNAESPAIGTRRCLEQSGFAFCLAPSFHPALKQVASVRRQIGTHTLFNCLGPLANPAGAQYQLLGVGRSEWLDRMADALLRLGTQHALLVCGSDGLDEVTLCGTTRVRQIRDGRVVQSEWHAPDFGLPSCRNEDLRASSPEDSAAFIRAVLDNRPGPAADVVLGNAAAALLAADRVANLREGVDLARDALRSKRALDVLHCLAAVSREIDGNAAPTVV